MAGAIDKDTLEDMIDRSSVRSVCEAIAEVLAEKAEHVRANWQDGMTATEWENASKAISHVAQTPAVRQVS